MQQFTSYSHEGQDIFAYYVCGKRGFFLDIGMGDPVKKNNTWELETSHGWNGVCIDSQSRATARNFHCLDVTSVDWQLFLCDIPTIIDYVSLDVDLANSDVLDRFPWQTYRFKCATVEHDAYAYGNALQKQAEQVLIAHGYEMALQDAYVSGKCWESWWVQPGLYAKNVDWAAYLKRLIAADSRDIDAWRLVNFNQVWLSLDGKLAICDVQEELTRAPGAILPRRPSLHPAVELQPGAARQ